MDNTSTRRQTALSPKVLPEHLRGIREQVVKDHIYTEYSQPSESDYAKVVMLVARAKLDDKTREEVLAYIESNHRSLKTMWERYHGLVDGIIQWAGWAANWTRRNGLDETKALPEEKAS